MSDYPLLERIKAKLKDKRESIGWLLGQIDKSNSWFFNIKSIEDIQLRTIMLISEKLEFDFLQDYYRWRNEDLPLLNEPSAKYGNEPEMAIQVTIRGGSSTFSKKVSRLLDTIIVEGAKEGLKVG